MGTSAPIPYLPIENAMAPNVPMGARVMIKASTANRAVERLSIRLRSGGALFAQLEQGEAEQDREEQNLEDGAGGEGADHRLRDDVHEELNAPGGSGGSARLGGHPARVQGRRVRVQAGARLDQDADDQADNHGQGRDDLEQEDGADADAPDLLHVRHLGQAGDDGHED